MNTLMESAVKHQAWSNWGGNQVCTPAYTLYPRTVEEVQEAVRFARSQQLTLRVVGGGHSFTPVVQTGGVLLDLKHLSGILETDTVGRKVRALGGTRLYDFGEPLWAKGLSLKNQGDIDHQTISGAISTGTHGSGIELGSFSSAVTAMTVVDANGDLVHIDDSDPDFLRAAQVSLGTFGVIVEVELQVQDSYYLQEKITYETTDELLEAWERNPEDSRHFSFLWCQDESSAGLYELPTPPGLAMTGRAYTKRYYEAQVDDESRLSDTEGARLDRAYRIYPGGFMVPFHELEYYVDTDVAKDAFCALKDLILNEYPEQKYPIETRWIRGDEGLISPFLGHDKVSLSVSGAPGTDYWPYLTAVDKLLSGFKATSHWGKIHLMTRERVDALFPDVELFRSYRRKMDSTGLFLNDHTRELFS